MQFAETVKRTWQPQTRRRHHCERPVGTRPDRQAGGQGRSLRPHQAQRPVRTLAHCDAGREPLAAQGDGPVRVFHNGGRPAFTR
jgi:hypothetical protein